MGCDGSCLNTRSTKADTAENLESARRQLKAVQVLQKSLNQITTKPFLSFELPTWTNGGLTEYHHFVITLRRKKLQDDALIPSAPTLTKVVCDTATQLAYEFWQSLAEKPKEPDTDWPAVVSNLAHLSDSLSDLQHQYHLEEKRFNSHLRGENFRRMTGSIQCHFVPSIQASYMDKKLLAELRVLPLCMDAMMEFSLECVKLVSVFLPSEQT